MAPLRAFLDAAAADAEFPRHCQMFWAERPSPTRWLCALLDCARVHHRINAGFNRRTAMVLRTSVALLCSVFLLAACAGPSGLSANMPDPGPDKLSLTAHVIWDVWASREISTDKLALNMTHVYEKRWWRFWKKTRFPITGIPPKESGTTQYRKRICANKLFTDDARFEYI